MSHSWENALISPDQSIREAMLLIDAEALRVALVVDAKRSLLGVVTDGDVRRGLLRGLTLENKVSEVMNQSPLAKQADMPKAALLELMENKDLLFIPLLDGEKVVGLETLHEALSSPSFDNPVFIMAGGFGSRLRPLTDNCPKPMLKVGGTPMLEIMIRQFKRFGFHNFYISTHFLPDVIMDYFGDGAEHGVSIKYVYEESPLGTGGALGLLPDDLPDLPLIVVNGDILTTVDFSKLLHFHNGYDAVATMCVRVYEYQIPFGVIEGEDHKITVMTEKPTHRYDINAGIYVVNPEVVFQVEVNEYIDMPTVLSAQINNGLDVFKFPVHEYWIDIGQMSDYERAQSEIHSLELA